LGRCTGCLPAGFNCREAAATGISRRGEGGSGHFNRCILEMNRCISEIYCGIFDLYCCILKIY
jgi:hypothetical protein